MDRNRRDVCNDAAVVFELFKVFLFEIATCLTFEIENTTIVSSDVVLPV